VKWAGQPLAIPRRQARALLYHLAARLEPVPREQLCFLFWPDTPESTARRNLSHLLTHLRRALPAPEVLLTANDCIALDPRRTWSDTAALEELSATLPGNPRFLGEAGALGAPQQTVDLYRGPFLAGFSLPTSTEFDAWAARERRVLERLYLEALATLIEERTSRGAYDEAIACAQRYLQTDDLAEEIHRRLIQLFAAAGNRRAALQQFERCAAILERELGVSPLPETRAVYRAILEERPPPLPRSTAEPGWTTLPGLDAPLVGREEALRQLEYAYVRARAGNGSVVLISGEAGIGKSRLMQYFATRLQYRALVLVGGGQPGAQPLPYQPITQALRAALRYGDKGIGGRGDKGTSFHSPISLSSHLPLSLSPVWLAEVSRLLPEVGTVCPDLPLPLHVEPDHARTRLFEALCQVVLALASGPQPLLLCLDDLHWADGTTLDWLAYLGTRLRDSRLLILGSYRSEEAHTVAELRHSLDRQGILSELRLAGLDVAAVLQLLRHLVGLEPGDDVLASRLQRATGGSPFFLLETLRALIEGGRPLHDLRNGEDLPLPDTVRQAVETRLGRLSAKARQVLEAGAILGPTFSFDLVRLTSGRRELEAMDGLDELVGRQLLAEQDAGYRFHHDLVRRAVVAGLSPVRRQLLHRRAGLALQQLDPHAVAALARHFQAGGEVKKALHYHGLAAQRAEALFAWREAEEHQGWMLELLDQLDPDCSRPDCQARRGQVLAERAHQRFLRGRLAERDADLAALAALAETSGDRNLRLQALAHQVRYLNLDGQYAEAIAAAEQGVALAHRLGKNLAHARFLAQIGFAHYFMGQPQPALTALESALEEAGEMAGPETRGRITHILGYVHLHLGNYTQALACQREAYTSHQAVGDYNRMAWDLTDMGIVYTRLNRLPEAEQHLTEALALARKVGSQPAESYALNNLGTLHYVRGDYSAALECHTESLALQRATGSRRGEASALANSGVVHLALGDCATAESMLRQAIGIQEAIRYESGLAEALAHLARVLAGLGRPDDALDAARQSLAVARRIEDRYSQVSALNALAQLHLDRGESVAALPLAGEAVALAEEAGLVHGRIFGLTALGLAYLALGDSEQAHRYAAQAVAMLQQQGCIEGPEETVYLAHSRVLTAMGRHTGAAQALSWARAEVEAEAGRIADPEQRRRYLKFHAVSATPVFEE
jgi:DNA-binding SARP family transcriptional activator